MPKKLVKFMVTAFRDGFQSVYGARVFTRDFLPAVEASRKAAGSEADLQTLARGANVVGLDSQPRDIIRLHARLFKKHGITTVRNFDALNDVNNLIYSGQCIEDAGLKHEVAVTMMELPPGYNGSHTPGYYMKVLRNILEAGIPNDSVVFKDASGTSVPSNVYETIKKARVMLPKGIHIHFHTHETAGTSVSSYKAVLPPEAVRMEPLIPFSPMPGGALTANTQMMRDSDILDKYNQVIAAACKEKGIAFLKGEGKIRVRKKEKEKKGSIPAGAEPTPAGRSRETVTPTLRARRRTLAGIYDLWG